jgi:hypothetical protein
MLWIKTFLDVCSTHVVYTYCCIFFQCKRILDYLLTWSVLFDLFALSVHWRCSINFHKKSYTTVLLINWSMELTWLILFDLAYAMCFFRASNYLWGHLQRCDALRTFKRTCRVRLRRSKWSKLSGRPFASGVAPGARRINFFFVHEAIIKKT